MSQRAIDGDFIYFVTTNVQNRRWFFVTPDQAVKLGQAIQTSCAIKHFALLAYCILPNHVHLLVKRLPVEEVKPGAGDAITSQRTLERVRCEKIESASENRYLFPHRRLSSRRCGRDEHYTLSELMKSIKGSFSRSLPKGKFWQHRSNFRIIESQEYFNHVVDYIRFNYRKMSLSNTYGSGPYVFVNWKVISRIAG